MAPRTGPVKSVYLKIRAKERKGKKFTFNDMLRSMPYFDTPACNKCRYNGVCPYFRRDGVCTALTELTGAPRDMPRFKRQIGLQYELLIKRSTLLTSGQTTWDVLKLFCVILLIQLLEKSSDLPNRYSKCYTSKDSTKLGSAKLMNASALKRAAGEAERRARNIGVDYRSKLDRRNMDDVREEFRFFHDR